MGNAVGEGGKGVRGRGVRGRGARARGGRAIALGAASYEAIEDDDFQERPGVPSLYPVPCTSVGLSRLTRLTNVHVLYPVPCTSVGLSRLTRLTNVHARAARPPARSVSGRCVVARVGCGGVRSWGVLCDDS